MDKQVKQIMEKLGYERVDELSKKTLGSYIPTAATSLHDIGQKRIIGQQKYERARDGLSAASSHVHGHEAARQAVYNAGVELSKTQNKSDAALGNKWWKRYAGIQRASKKLAKESVEVDPVEELSKPVLKSYVNKAKDSMRSADQETGRHESSDAKSSFLRWIKSSAKAQKRSDGIDKAVDKLSK